MYQSPRSPIPIPPQFSIPTRLPWVKPIPCADIDKIRDELQTCLINESSLITCAGIFSIYRECLRKN